MQDAIPIAEGLPEGTASLLCKALREYEHVSAVHTPDKIDVGTHTVWAPKHELLAAVSLMGFVRGFFAGREGG